ncbi:MAG: acylneuraminate cytidylyltransferase [Pseudomonadota bacterium]
MQGVVALIPARSGSKGILKKNIKDMAGHPLVYWVAKAASDSGIFEKIYVSTDSEEIAQVVRELELPGVVPISRAPETATDAASTELVIADFTKRVDWGTLFLIQATSPLLRAEDLKKALKAFNDVNADGCEAYDSMLSGVTDFRFQWHPLVNNEAHFKAFNYEPRCRKRRQEMKPQCLENGAFYITNRAAWELSHCRLSGTVGFYEMPQETIFEVDTLEDWKIIENLLLVRGHEVAFVDSKGLACGIKKEEEEKWEDCHCLDPKRKTIKAVAIDVDGTLTDGGILLFLPNGQIARKFSVIDGQGISLLKGRNVHIVLISGEDDEGISARAEKLGVVFLVGCKNKVEELGVWLEEAKISWESLAYIGDDLNDLDCLKKAGFSATPKDSQLLRSGPLGSQIQNDFDFVCHFSGGSGAVREFCDYLIKGDYLV